MVCLPTGIGKKGNRVSKKRKTEEVTTRIPLSTIQTPGSNHLLFSNHIIVMAIINGLHPHLLCTPQVGPHPHLLCTIQVGPHPHPLLCQLHTIQVGPHPHPLCHLHTIQLGCHHIILSPLTQEFKLCFRTGNISSCNGCRNKFAKKAPPPMDICIQHAEWRSFTSPSTQLPDSRFGNAYYHANIQCVWL